MDALLKEHAKELFWDDALMKGNKMYVMPKIVPSGSACEINTLEELRGSVMSFPLKLSYTSYSCLLSIIDSVPCRYSYVRDLCNV